MSQPEHVGDDSGRLVILHSVLDELGVRGEEVDNLPGLGLADEVGVDLSHVLREDDVGVLSLDRAQSDMGVLDVGTGVTLERGHSLDVKRVVVDSIMITNVSGCDLIDRPCPKNLPPGGHVLNLNGGLTDDITGILGVLDLSVLFGILGHLLVHAVLGLGENVVQELDGSLSGRHAHDHTCVSRRRVQSGDSRRRHVHATGTDQS